MPANSETQWYLDQLAHTSFAASNAHYGDYNPPSNNQLSANARYHAPDRAQLGPAIADQVAIDFTQPSRPYILPDPEPQDNPVLNAEIDNALRNAVAELERHRNHTRPAQATYVSNEASPIAMQSEGGLNVLSQYVWPPPETTNPLLNTTTTSTGGTTTTTQPASNGYIWARTVGHNPILDNTLPQLVPQNLEDVDLETSLPANTSPVYGMSAHWRRVQELQSEIDFLKKQLELAIKDKPPELSVIPKEGERKILI